MRYFEKRDQVNALEKKIMDLKQIEQETTKKAVLIDMGIHILLYELKIKFLMKQNKKFKYISSFN